MKKLLHLSLFAFLLTLCCTFFASPVYAENNDLRVISNKSIVYLCLDYTNELLFDISDAESTLPTTDPKFNTVNNFGFYVYHNNILQTTADPIEKAISVNTTTQTFLFYKIDVAAYNQAYSTSHLKNESGEYLQTYGYVLSTSVMPNKNSSLKIYLDTNATLIKTTNCQTYKFNFSTQSYEESVILPAGKNVKLVDGYNKNNKYTKIQYQTDDLFIETCYVETNMLAVSKISVGAICAIMISVACISIILILLGIKNKTKKFKKIKNKLSENS